MVEGALRLFSPFRTPKDKAMVEFRDITAKATHCPIAAGAPPFVVEPSPRGRVFTKDVGAFCLIKAIIPSVIVPPDLSHTNGVGVVEVYRGEQGTQTHTHSKGELYTSSM
jgi:hypothetical protein